MVLPRTANGKPGGLKRWKEKGARALIPRARPAMKSRRREERKKGDAISDSALLDAASLRGWIPSICFYASIRDRIPLLRGAEVRTASPWWIISGMPAAHLVRMVTTTDLPPRYEPRWRLKLGNAPNIDKIDLEVRRPPRQQRPVGRLKTRATAITTPTPAEAEWNARQ